MRRGISGQITVFLAITMAAVLSLAGLLVDLARINAGRGMVEKAVKMAAGSLLTDYSSKLKDGYGLFALSSSDEEGLTDLFSEYLSSNLNIPCDDEYYMGNTDLFGFRIERIDVTPIYNLSENHVTKKQILEYMKYRAPAGMAGEFIEKLTAVRDVGKMSNAYKQKVGIDKILGRMDKSQQKLKKSIDGTGDVLEKFINGFNINDSWITAFNDFNSLTRTLADLDDKLESLDMRIRSIESQLAEIVDNSAGNPGENSTENANGNPLANSSENRTANSSVNSAGNSTVTAIDELEEKLKELLEEKKQVIISRSSTVNTLDELWYKIRNSLTFDYINSNETALSEISKIAEKGQKAKQAITELENYLEENFSGEENAFGSSTLFSDFKDQMQEELNALKELVLEGQKAEEMINSININISVLRGVISEMDRAKENAGGLPAGGLHSGLLDIVGRYIKIDYDYSKPERGDRSDDPRSGKADAVRELIYERLLDEKSYEAAGIARADLPSFSKVMTESFEQRDAEFVRNVGSGTGENTVDVREAAYDGDLAHIGDDADLFDEESMFQENALGFISDIGSLISDQTVSLRDSIFINEYIMGTFKNSVPVLTDGTEPVKDVNLHGDEKERIETFYDSEVEYILHGNASQKMNNILTKGQLMLVRIALNTLHVYTDPAKRTKATAIATSVAGWWTGGAGIPVISNLIMCGWGVGESVIDVIDLMEGRSVPIYKMKGDWRLDIGLASQSGPKTDRRLYFNYHDYLRLFLLTVSEEKRLSRVEDLIQLNIGKSKGDYDEFRMSSCHTYLRIEAEVSTNYLFITQPFIRKQYRTGDGRYVYKVLLYEGY